MSTGVNLGVTMQPEVIERPKPPKAGKGQEILLLETSEGTRLS